MTTSENALSTPSFVQVAYRHPWPVRLWHWANAGAVLALLLTGLLIFDIHPHLYWGEAGQEGEGAFLSFTRAPADNRTVAPEGAPADSAGSTAPPRTQWTLGRHHWGTGKMGSILEDGFGGSYLLVASPPADWQFGATRGWHFAFAWFLGFSLPAYAIYLLVSRRLTRTLLPSREELRPRSLAQELWKHLRFHRARGAEARHYNSLQKMTYLAVIFVLIPAMVLSGIAMSNTASAVWPHLSLLFGGHQSARSVHFITAMLLLVFVLVHVFQVFVAGFANQMRGMITGRFVIGKESAP
jgi:thiosulfate reductase cytochrome b subunit